jgi:hypothetical protein
VKKSLNSFLLSLKKSVLADCVSPRAINGIRKTTELLNRLNKPLSAGVKKRGLVNTGSSKKDIPFVKKLENVYIPADLNPFFLLSFVIYAVSIILFLQAF